MIVIKESDTVYNATGMVYKQDHAFRMTLNIETRNIDLDLAIGDEVVVQIQLPSIGTTITNTFKLIQEHDDEPVSNVQLRTYNFEAQVSFRYEFEFVFYTMELVVLP